MKRPLRRERMNNCPLGSLSVSLFPGILEFRKYSTNPSKQIYFIGNLLVFPSVGSTHIAIHVKNHVSYIINFHCHSMNEHKRWKRQNYNNAMATRGNFRYCYYRTSIKDDWISLNKDEMNLSSIRKYGSHYFAQSYKLIKFRFLSHVNVQYVNKIEWRFIVDFTLYEYE